jgi:hypothetical protein
MYIPSSSFTLSSKSDINKTVIVELFFLLKVAKFLVIAGLGNELKEDSQCTDTGRQDELSLITLNSLILRIIIILFGSLGAVYSSKVYT